MHQFVCCFFFYILSNKANEIKQDAVERRLVSNLDKVLRIHCTTKSMVS